MSFIYYTLVKYGFQRAEKALISLCQGITEIGTLFFSPGSETAWRRCLDGKIGQKTRNIHFYSEKNGKMICLYFRHARDYAKYLEAQSWVERYEADLPLLQKLYAHINFVGIRGAYFQVH